MLYSKRKAISVVFVILSCLLFCVSVTFAASSNLDWADGNISMEGYGAPPETSRTPGQAKILARRAAILDAYRNLGEYVEGVRIDSETTVKNMVVSDDIVRSRVSAVIKGAKIISEKMNDDGSYTVVLGLPMYGKTGSVASAVLPKWDTVESFPGLHTNQYPSTSTDNATQSPAAEPPIYTNIKAQGSYTGLIVDCRGLGLQPAMSPTIRNSSGTPIYGHKNLDYEKVIQNGMAGYSKDGYSNLDRAGNRPLIVKAVRLDGHDCNPVLSIEDANRVLVENQASGFLNKCAVVFIR